MKLVLFFFFSAYAAQASIVTSSVASEINQFSAEWCAPNQVIGQDIKFICIGSAMFGGVASTRAVVVQRADRTRELFIEKDFSSIDMLNLRFDVIGPVATNKPREPFSPKYNGVVQLDLDVDGEAEAVSGSLRLAEQFFAVKP